MLLDTYWVDAKRMSCNLQRILPGSLIIANHADKLHINCMVTNNSSEKPLKNFNHMEVQGAYMKKGTTIHNIVYQGRKPLVYAPSLHLMAWKKTQKVPARCLRHLWTFCWALWFLVYGLLSSIKSTLRGLKFFPTHSSRSLFTLARPDLQSIGEKRKEFGLHTWFFNRTLQYPQASSAKTRLLAGSTESKFCRLQICGRFPQPWSPSALPAGRPWSVLCKVRGHVSFKTRPSCTLLLYMNFGASANKSYSSIVGWGKEKTGCWAGNSEVSCWLVTLI